MKLWVSERLEDKRTVLKLAFAERLAYTRNEGFRTAVPALPFKVLADLKCGKTEMARPEGFEPPTRRVEIDAAQHLRSLCVSPDNDLRIASSL